MTFDLISSLLEANLFSLKDKKTPLMYAAALGSIACVKMLISKGADVNAVDGDGNNVLWSALDCKYEEDLKAVITILLGNGADPFQKNVEGNTPFECACECSYELIEILEKRSIKKNLA